MGSVFGWSRVGKAEQVGVPKRKIIKNGEGGGERAGADIRNVK